MNYFIVALLLAGATALHAQHAVQNSSISLISPVVLKQDARSAPLQVDFPGKRMRNTGRTLTILGIGFIAGGIAMVSQAEETYYTSNYSSNGSYEEGDPQGAFGVLMITGGAGMMVPGIIFWSKGAKKYNAAIRESEAASVHLKSNGLAIRYRF